MAQPEERPAAGTLWDEIGLAFTQKWSSAAMLSLYQHVVSDLRRDAANRVADFLHRTG